MKRLLFNNPVSVMYPDARQFTASTLLQSRLQWSERYYSRYFGMKAALPVDLHLLSFKVRNAVSDDTIVRLQSLTDSQIVVDKNPFDISADMEIFKQDSPPAGAYAMTMTSVRPRTLSLNRPAKYLYTERLHFPSNDQDRSLFKEFEVAATGPSPQPQSGVKKLWPADLLKQGVLILKD
jgi:hypothetical protein